MKTVYFVRHAKSSWKFDLRDHDRPLNKRGKRDAPNMGILLKQMNVLPDVIYSSSAVRANTTANTIAEAIGFPVDDIIINSNLYHAGTIEVVPLIRKLDNQVDSVMFFGHNPGFTDLANELGDEFIMNVPTCGAVGVEFDVDDWSAVNEENGKTAFFEFPKKHFYDVEGNPLPG